ncbi:MAG: hypothetical protein ABIG61_06990 [Planctomycetota bacterium]
MDRKHCSVLGGMLAARAILSRQVGKLALDVGTNVLPRAAAAEAIIKLRQKWRL